MPDLVVTSAVLEESSAKLASIKDEFDHAGDRVREEADVWGQNDVRKAMADFVHNWSIHRGHISDAVGDLKKKIDDAVTYWDNTEKGLSNSLQTESS